MSRNKKIFKMKNIILIGLLLASTFVFSQNCKYKVNGIDQFTGKMTKLTKKKQIIKNFNSEGYVALQKTDTLFSLILSYRTSFSKKVTVNEGAELSFLIQGGEIITLKKTSGNYTVSKNQLKTLMTTKTDTIRYYYTDQGGDYKYQDIEIKKSNAETFMDLIKCVL